MSRFLPKYEVDSEFSKEREGLLWKQFKMGDVDAYEAIYRKNVQSLYTYGQKITQDLDLIKDCIQDLFIEIWKKRESLADVNYVTPYLWRSLQRKIISELKKRKNIADIDAQNTDHLISEFTTEDGIIKKEHYMEQNKILNNKLERLTSRQREIIYLKYFTDYSYTEIAGILSLSIKATYKLMDRALSSLRESL